MAVINNAAPAQDSSGGLGFLLGVIALLLFFFFLIYYGLPAMRNSFSSPQINVPGQIDVNLRQDK